MINQMKRNSALPTRNINYKEGMHADMKLRARSLASLASYCY
jgi:hypothetical protein